MKILFVGPQGSGKSTQAKLLSEYLKVPYISTGDIFRDVSKKDTEDGKRIKQILESGGLVDDQTTSEIVEQRVHQPDCQGGYILDGYPRNLEQVRLFDPGFDKVVDLRLSDEEATKRLLARGREDDTEESIAQRLRLYHEQTDPLLDYYQKANILEVIDGQGTIDDIQQTIREKLGGQK